MLPKIPAFFPKWGQASSKVERGGTIQPLADCADAEVGDRVYVSHEIFTSSATLECIGGLPAYLTVRADAPLGFHDVRFRTDWGTVKEKTLYIEVVEAAAPSVSPLAVQPKLGDSQGSVDQKLTLTLNDTSPVDRNFNVVGRLVDVPNPVLTVPANTTTGQADVLAFGQGLVGVKVEGNGFVANWYDLRLQDFGTVVYRNVEGGWQGAASGVEIDLTIERKETSQTDLFLSTLQGKGTITAFGSTESFDVPMDRSFTSGGSFLFNATLGATSYAIVFTPNDVTGGTLNVQATITPTGGGAPTQVTVPLTEK